MSTTKVARIVGGTLAAMALTTAVAPGAGAVTTAPSPASMTVCVSGLNGNDGTIVLAGPSTRKIWAYDGCTTFSQLAPGTYRVTLHVSNIHCTGAGATTSIKASLHRTIPLVADCDVVL
jgi:hypothetical protein